MSGKQVSPQELIDSLAGEWSKQTVAMVFGVVSLISAMILSFYSCYFLFTNKDRGNREENNKFLLVYLWIGFSLYGPIWLFGYIGMYFPKMSQTPWLIWLIEIVDYIFLKMFGPIFGMPLALGVVTVMFLPFYWTVILLKRSFRKLKKLGKLLKRKWQENRGDLGTIRKWKDFCKYPKWTGFLIGIIGTILAIYQNISGGWLAASGMVLGGASELTKKRLQKWESELLSQESLITNINELVTSPEVIELGEINDQNQEVTISIPSTSSSNLRLRQSSL